MTSKPSGTVTFLFTDIENSTQLAREHPEAWEAAQARHHAILREAIELNEGFVFQIIGDAFCAAFHKAGDALKASIKAQQDLQDEPWDEFTIYARMGIHTGEAEIEGNEYRGYTTLSFVQRLMSAGHGGQILISNATENLLREQLPGQISLRNMGMQKFAGMPSSVRVFQVVASDLPIEFPPLRTLDNLPNNLPVQLTSFVGREKELTEVNQLLKNSRILTLIGPGGAGKTRLSIQAASELLDQYPDGIWLVEFAPILDPLLVPRTTAIAIGLRYEPQRPVIDMLCDYLHEKKMLIVLDNCEHLVDACARMADHILHAAPNTRILASSREALGIGGEVSYRVPSLGLPDIQNLPSIETLSQYEAVKLFIDRARSAVPTFAVTNDNAPALAQVCYHLDGIPLAIELAAAKIRVLSVEQIAKRLDDRFKLLTSGSRTVLERHQTLRAAIDWSYKLLSPTEQVLFQRLSVFVDGCTLEAAESVCEGGAVRSDDILNLLEQLVNKSLVITEEEGHASRYHMLETLRQYAYEKLVEAGEGDALDDRHLQYFLDLAETAEPYLIRPEQLEWLSLLDADYENIRFAFEWALSKESVELSLNFCKALWWFWEIRSYWLEGLSWTTRALAKPTQNESKIEKVARARALYIRALLDWQLGNTEEFISFGKTNIVLQEKFLDKRDMAITKLFVGAALFKDGKFDKACTILEQSFAEFQELNDLFWQTQCFGWLGMLLSWLNKLKYSDMVLKNLEFARKSKERLSLADALSSYADWLYRMGGEQAAREHAEESDTLYKQIKSENSSGNLELYACMAWGNGDYQKAKSLFLELEERFSLLGGKSIRALLLRHLGRLAMEQGDLQQAQVDLEQALELSRETRQPALTAYCLLDLSILFYRHGNVGAFQQNAREGLALKNDQAKLTKSYQLLLILNSIYVQNPESSARLLGVINQTLRQSDYAFRPVDQRSYYSAETYVVKSLGDAAFETAFAEGQKMTLDDALDLALKMVEEIDEIVLPSDTEPQVIPDRLPSRVEAEKQKYGGLTTREREVAAQIAQGKSNQAIAAELFVGLKTVEAHVTRMLTKLGFTSRAQIAAWAVSKGLAEAPRDLDTLGKEG